MHSTEILLNASDLPEEAGLLLQRIMELKNLIEEVDYDVRYEAAVPKITVKKEFFQKLYEITYRRKEVDAFFLELVRKYYEYLNPAEIKKFPRIQPRREEKADKLKGEEEKPELPIREVYLNELTQDLLIRAGNIQKYEVEKGTYQSADAFVFYMSEINIYLEYILNAMQRAKARWYEKIKIEPFSKRRLKKKKLLATLNWRLDALNQAAYKLIEYLTAMQAKHNQDFVEMAVNKIASFYYDKVYSLVGVPELGKLHESKEFTPLNTVLRVAVQGSGKDLMNLAVEPLVTEEEPNIVRRANEDFNLLMPRIKEREIAIDLYYALQDPFNEEMEQSISFEERRALFTRPNQKDFTEFWNLFILFLLAGAGAAVVIKTPEELKAKAMTEG
jgi:hypothetical protein